MPKFDKASQTPWPWPHLWLILLLNNSHDISVSLFCVFALTKLSNCRFFCTVHYNSDLHTEGETGKVWLVESEVDLISWQSNTSWTQCVECDQTFYFYMNSDAAPQTLSDWGIIRAPIWNIHIDVPIFVHKSLFGMLVSFFFCLKIKV